MGQKIANAIVLVVGIGIIYVGVQFLLAPEASALGYGVAASTSGADQGAFLAVKGVRDIGTGLVVLTLLVLGQRQALGWVMLALSVIPVSDGLIVLTHDGSVAAAFGWHFSTAAGMLVAVALILSVAAPQAATQPSVQRS